MDGPIERMSGEFGLRFGSLPDLQTRHPMEDKALVCLNRPPSIYTRR